MACITRPVSVVSCAFAVARRVCPGSERHLRLACLLVGGVALLSSATPYLLCLAMDAIEQEGCIRLRGIGVLTGFQAGVRSPGGWRTRVRRGSVRAVSRIGIYRPLFRRGGSAAHLSSNLVRPGFANKISMRRLAGMENRIYEKGDGIWLVNM